MPLGLKGRAAHNELATDYLFEPRGTIEVKGIGAVETWWLTGHSRSASGQQAT